MLIFIWTAEWLDATPFSVNLCSAGRVIVVSFARLCASEKSGLSIMQTPALLRPFFGLPEGAVLGEWPCIMTLWSSM